RLIAQLFQPGCHKTWNGGFPIKANIEASSIREGALHKRKHGQEAYDDNYGLEESLHSDTPDNVLERSGLVVCVQALIALWISPAEQSGHMRRDRVTGVILNEQKGTAGVEVQEIGLPAFVYDEITGKGRRIPARG